MKLSPYKYVILVVVGLLLLASIGRSLHSIIEATPTMASLHTLPTIVIDPGHGGVDGGAVGVDGIVEKNINLNISLAMRDLFVVNGFDVVMTRETDISIHDEGIKGTRKQKTSDLHNRLAIAHEHPDTIFISIHQNKFGDSRSHGTQIFFGPNAPESEALAQITQERFRTFLQPENTRQKKKAGKNLFLMYTAKCPAILIECGFLSNAQEAALLSQTEYQYKVAFTALCSVLEYLQLDAPQPSGETAAWARLPEEPVEDVLRPWYVKKP